MSGAVNAHVGGEPTDAPRACPACGSEKLGTRFCTECSTELVPPVAVTHAFGPMWAVNGHVLTVHEGEDVRRAVLDAVANLVDATAPVRVVVTDGQLVTKVEGSSVAEGADAASWAGPGRADLPLAVAGRQTLIVGVHPTAGATTWAQLLDLPEAELADELAGPVVLVCRSTPAGINATKAAIHSLGPAAVDAVLVVADAPGNACSLAPYRSCRCRGFLASGRWQKSPLRWPGSSPVPCNGSPRRSWGRIQ
jgi:hypothetical protein